MESIKKVCNVNNGKTSGSALVIVLGILSVLMLMSVAFSTFMRTERGATTNLKNAHVAEQALHSALAAAIQAIDDSLAETQDGHSNAVVDSPVAVWPQPWLASCAPDDRGSKREKNDSRREYNRRNDGYFQSRLRDGSDPVPSVLCSGAAEYMTSNQIAMVRSAAVGWAPLYSGIGASSIAKDSAATMGVNAGYPQNSESIVGRYAFVALDTTGYLDLGKIGTFDVDERKASSGDDPWRFIPVDGNLKAKTPGGTEIPSPFTSSSTKGDRKKLSDFLSSQKALFSPADVKAVKGAAGFNWKTPAQAKKDRLAFMPPDLYAGTGVSLAPLNPEGEPKIALPYGEDGAKLSLDDLNELALRVYPAMVSVFARSRKAGGVEKWWENENLHDAIDLYHGFLADIPITKAALATVGLLDALDGDGEPGKKEGANDDDSYWSMLADIGDNGKINVKMWDDSDDTGGVLQTVTSSVDDAVKQWPNPLNYPCTVGAPLLKTFYAYVEIDPQKTGGNVIPNGQRTPNPETAGHGFPTYREIFNTHYKEYDAVLHVGAIAADDNRDDTIGARSLNAELEVTFDVLAQTPTKAPVPCASFVDTTTSGDVRRHVEFPENGEFSKEIEWTEFWKHDERWTAKPEEKISESISSGHQRFIVAKRSFPFKIKCGVKDVVVDSAGNTNITYFPCTRNQYLFEKNGSYGDKTNEDKVDKDTAYANVWVPIRFKAEVRIDGKTVQKVPAPFLETRAPGYWWVRVDAGVYHADSNGSEGDLEKGWAECLVPQFGMDTTSLATSWDPELGEMPSWDACQKFWINNVCARAGYTDNISGRKLSFSELQEMILDEASEEIVPPYITDTERWFPPFIDGNDGSVRSAVTDWLFAKSYCDNPDDRLWSAWFNQSEDPSSCPDLMHQLSGIDDENQNWIGKTKIGVNFHEIHTHFRAGGITSVADLGSLLIGPYETLSLFKMWRSPPYQSGKSDSDFHPVFDYFTMDEDRYPASKDLSDVELSADGTVDWNSLGTRSSAPKQRHLFSAVQNGRVNLNLPRLLEYYEDVDDKGNKAVRVRRADEFNPYPLATALNGAPYPGLKNDRPVKQSVSEQAAVDIASAYANMLRNVDRHPTESEYKAATMVNHVTNLVELARASKKGSVSVIRAPAVRDVSFFASAGGTSSNAVLKAFLDGLKDTASGEVNQRQNLCDDMREGFLRGVSDAFTTRGQSFLLVLRADAYTARFGRQEDPTDGTSLASSHALVELFRDPEPARLPDGTFPRDADGNPVLYHNWFIRSFRLF